MSPRWRRIVSADRWLAKRPFSERSVNISLDLLHQNEIVFRTTSAFCAASFELVIGTSVPSSCSGDSLGKRASHGHGTSEPSFARTHTRPSTSELGECRVSWTSDQWGATAEHDCHDRPCVQKWGWLADLNRGKHTTLAGSRTINLTICYAFCYGASEPVNTTWLAPRSRLRYECS